MKSRKQSITGLLDLTSLNDKDTEEDIIQLCKKAVNPLGKVAAVCIWPQFIRIAKKSLEGQGISVATVLNFPEGQTPNYELTPQIEQILADRPDEIDYVFNYKRYLSGRRNDAINEAKAVLKYIPDDIKTKVILETGEIGNIDTVKFIASEMAELGFNFLKTSTGKTKVSATIPAVKALLEVAADFKIGVKPSGGIREYAEADNYLCLAEKYLGEVSSDNFRIGASSLLDKLLEI